MAGETLTLDVRQIGEQFLALGEMAYREYAPLVLDVLLERAPEHELELLLDYICSFALFDSKMEEVYKLVCRQYARVYPRMISEHVEAYLKMCEEDELECDEDIL